MGSYPTLIEKDTLIHIQLHTYTHTHTHTLAFPSHPALLHYLYYNIFPYLPLASKLWNIFFLCVQLIDRAASIIDQGISVGLQVIKNTVFVQSLQKLRIATLQYLCNLDSAEFMWFFHFFTRVFNKINILIIYNKRLLC